MTQSFRLAPMAPLIRWLTLLLCALPVAFVAAALANPASLALLWVALLLAALYAAVWIWWRPSRFAVSARGIELMFPGRRRRIAAASITAAAVLDRAAFTRQFGRALRVGAGGLWGGFGWLWTSNGWVEFYVSALDRYVLVRRHGHMPLLISPEDPEAMVAALEAQIPRLKEVARAQRSAA
jgi:hypothetical protein